MSFFSSISRVAGWCLLKTYLRKIEKHLMRDLFRENCRIVDHSLIKMKLNTDALLESLFLQQKGYHDDMKENLNFKQLQLDYINNQKQKEKKHIRLVTVSIEVDVVAKIDDEVSVLSTIKIYSYVSFVFSGVPKTVELLKTSKVMQLL